jgi:hypothetical protein
VECESESKMSILGSQLCRKVLRKAMLAGGPRACSVYCARMGVFGVRADEHCSVSTQHYFHVTSPQRSPCPEKFFPNGMPFQIHVGTKAPPWGKQAWEHHIQI